MPFKSKILSKIIPLSKKITFSKFEPFLSENDKMLENVGAETIFKEKVEKC